MCWGDMLTVVHLFEYVLQKSVTVVQAQGFQILEACFFFRGIVIKFWIYLLLRGANEQNDQIAHTPLFQGQCSGSKFS